MAADSFGPKNEPQFAGTGVPQDAADLTTVAAYAARVGNFRVDTSAVRAALSGADLWIGLYFYENDTGVTWRYESGGWVIATPITPRLRMQRSAAAGISAGSWQAVGMTSGAQEGGNGFAFSSGTFQVPVTGNYAVRERCSTPTTTTGVRRMLGIATTGNVAGALAQSSGTGAANDSSGFGIDFLTELTLQAGTTYTVSAYSGAALNFTNFDVTVRLIAPTSIG